MTEESENKTENAVEVASADNATESAAVAPVSDVKKRRLPLIKSIPVRATISYSVFSLIILILFYLVFFACLYIFYGSFMENEIERLSRSAATGFPKQMDDGVSAIYKYRLFEVARSNKPVAIAVFKKDESDNIEICIVVDDMGNGISDNSDLFDSVMTSLNFDDVLKNGNIAKVGTPYGTYMCKGSTHATDGGDPAYLLVMKPYDIWNTQTVKIVYILIVCTVIVFVLACVFALIASRHDTKQLTDFSQKAKRLADGDYNVQFSGYGYNEYENLACALNSATHNMQKAEKMQREIVANVSHDIRTPLTMIRAYAEMLRDIPMDADKREKTAGVIISEADRLTALVSDVLNYSGLQSGAAVYKMEKCDISLIASAVLTGFDVVRECDGINFVSEIDDEAIATCDKQKIEQVFYNLVSNAVNYCGDDKTVILRVQKQESCVRVEVEDHGNGIAQEDLDSVWDRYFRSEHSSRKVVGTGLGLSICKSVLMAHSADFGVISEIGKGSTFWFELK